MTSHVAGLHTGAGRHSHWPPVTACARSTARHSRILIVHLLLACLAMPGAQANGTPEALEHIVVVWLKSPGNAEHRRRIITGSEVLRGIPGVTGLRMGEMIPSDRAIVDSTFDVALIVSFADRAAMETYLTHPVHLELVEQTLKPLVEKIRVYDFQ